MLSIGEEGTRPATGRKPLWGADIWAEEMELPSPLSSWMKQLKGRGSTYKGPDVLSSRKLSGGGTHLGTKTKYVTTSDTTVTAFYNK